MDLAELVGSIVAGLALLGGGAAGGARWAGRRRGPDEAGESVVSRSEADRLVAAAQREQQLVDSLAQLTRDVAEVTAAVERLRAKVHEHTSGLAAHEFRLGAQDERIAETRRQAGLDTAPHAVVPQRGRR